jgi:two-component system chemotaxis sensor kinase CheA
MDVVKTNIESLGGGIDIDSLPGKGTTVRLRIPLTLAIVNALVVVSGDSYLALPQSGIVELLRLQGQRLKTLVETSAGTKVLRFRGRLLPLLDLRTILNPTQDKPIEDEDSAISIVVVRGEGRIFALSVDRILDAQEIVVKPLPAPLRHLAVYGGTTLLGDGSVALILDIPGLADAGGVSGEAGASTDIPPAQASAEQVRPLLLVELVAGRRHGFLLDRVERLEEIESSKIEITSRGMVTPYRGGLLPLINLPELFGGNSVPGRENIHPVVVHSQKSGLYGIMVRQILNTVEEPWTIATGGVSPGIAALALVRGRPTEILDPSYWCDQGVHHG